MSKILEEQVQKAQMLVDGLKKNREQVKARGVTDGQIAELEQKAEQLKAMNEEVERLRDELSRKSKAANRQMMETKGKLMELKHFVKRYFEPGHWRDLGVPDKR